MHIQLPWIYIQWNSITCVISAYNNSFTTLRDEIVCVNMPLFNDNSFVFWGVIYTLFDLTWKFFKNSLSSLRLKVRLWIVCIFISSYKQSTTRWFANKSQLDMICMPIYHSSHQVWLTSASRNIELSTEVDQIPIMTRMA